jgi:spore coat protein A
MHFTDFTGEYVYHCHILAHEDHGMMGTVKVEGP